MSITLTAERLREVLDYDPATGVFRWRRSRRGIRRDRVAGCVNKRGYRVVHVDGRFHYAHRLAWLYVRGSWPPKFIDHENGCPDDNRISNLREATSSQNNANRKSVRVGLKGIYQHHEGYWCAEAKRGTDRRRFGGFRTPQQAHAAYVRAARELHGEFARSS